MKKKFGEIFRKKENLKTNEEQSNISGKENKIEKPKIALSQKVQNLKTKISQNKVKVISSVVAILAIILTAIIAINQASKTQNGLSGISPELAKAMTYPEVEEGEEIVDKTNNCVTFDAFFLRDLNGDGYAESVRGTSKEIGGEDTLYMELNVQTAGSLKDAKITINGENFYLQTALPKDNELKDNYVGNNTKEIEFNQINNGTQKLLTGIVRSGDYSYTSSKADAIGNNINNYSKVNSVTLTGTYVGADGTETPIEKTVEFNIDWYGTTSARIYTTNQNQNINNAINEEEGTINLNFTVYTEETEKELILSKNHIEGTIPKLNDYAPIEVVYTGSNGVFNYDAETMTFTLDRTAQTDEEGNVTSGLSRTNSYGIKVVYPIEAYQSLGAETVTIKIPVKTYYEGYNNPNEQFTNPYKSNIVSATIVASYEKPVEHTYASYFDVTVGKYVYEPTYRYIVSKQKPLRIYNGESEEETDDTYTVTWRGYVGTNAKLDGMVMKETKDGEEQVTDEFIKTDSSVESMDEVASNVGIYFSNADSMLGENGEIKVYDEDTGNLLVTFTQKDWNKYTANNPYKYEIPVKHIRVETSAIQKNEASLYVYNIKEIDDDKITTKYTREEFDKLQYIKSTLVGYIAGEYVGTDTHQANYEAPISVAEISISKNTISTQSTEKNEKITIQAYADQTANQVKWQNGTFLVKLPEEIIDAQVNNVTINNPQVTLENYELIEQDGISFIKIVTKNTTPQTFQITIDVDLSPDPRIVTTTKQIELYATNENGSDYYYKAQDIYDVNNNLNTEEMVNHRTTSLSMVSPNSLLTNQTATDYDDQGSEVVSPEVADIKPVYAVVDQEQPEEQTAKIGVQVKNNYASTISEIEILGKIPFEGNTYVISNADLGSTFTTKMINTGIEVPAELNGIATVYYSDNENPDRDLSKAENNWKTQDQVENWDNIKTFLIDLGDYVMPTGKEFVFNYTVKIPNGLEFNQVSFSHHGVYFCLDTDQGKYRTETEPNKLGFRIAEKYDLELTKYQTGKDKLVPGATYSITEITKGEEGTDQTEIRGESKTAVTNSQGKLTITNLYAEKEYEIKEINSPDDYELNGNVIRFIGYVDEEGNLTVEKTEGTTKGEITVAKEEGENYKVNVQVEDEVKASIKITKKEEGTDTTIQGARFKLTGYNLGENGKTLTTNANGELTFNGLSVNQEYTLQEVKAEGYYLANPIKFKIVNNEGNYVVEKIEDETATGEIKEQTTTEEEGIPIINIVLEDEKIPTYDLQLIKVKKTTESTVSEDELIAKAETALADTEVEYLAGAKFKLYKGTEEIGAYTTDETGKVTIAGLYQYETEKDIDQTYTLKEVLAPTGYAKVKDITFKVEEIDGALVLKEINEYGEEIAGENYTAEGNTIKLTIEDSPSFKLIKKDAETQSTIPNVKFAIYNVENGEVPATDSKGELIGTKETINGKEYYTITTDQNGEITADLPEGLYKAVEVKAPEQYDISNSTYYFGIGASREAETTMGVEFATSVGGSHNDYIDSVATTSDGGYIAGGYFYSDEIQVGEYTFSSNGSYDGMLIKYSSSGEVEWARSVGGNGNDQIVSVASTSDGGVIAGGYFYSSSIQVGEYTLTNSNTNSGSDGMLIKYNSSGEVEWVKSVGGSSSDYIYSVDSTEDGKIIVGGYFNSKEIQIGEYTLINDSSYDDANGSYYSEGMIIKYNIEGDIKSVESIGGDSDDIIQSITVTKDGGYIVGGYFRSSSIQVGEYTLTNNNTRYIDGMLIKYSASGEVEWARSVGGSNSDQIQSVASTKDGGIIVGGIFTSSSIQVGEYTLTNNSRSTGYSDGMVIKYSISGEVEWARNIGGSNDDGIQSVAETEDGGVIIGGIFTSSSIQVGDYTLTRVGGYDGMVIKYSSTGEVEWARSVGGSSSDSITSVAATRDGGYIAGGYFQSSEIQVGEYMLTNNSRSTSYSDGMVIKYSEKELINVDITKAEGIGGSYDDEITSVTSTSDGGYIAGGYFGSSIQVGEYTLTNSGNYDGMLIKYSATGEVEWARSVGGSSSDQITSVSATRDGGYIAGGYFQSSEIQVGDETLTTSGGYDGMLIKYSSSGEVEWARSVGGSNTDQIQSIAETSEGGYIAGGYFYSDEIQVGEYTLTNNGRPDGMLIKYSHTGEVEWAKSVGEIGGECINYVVATSDGGYIAGGYFQSSKIQVGEYTLTNSSSGYSDGMVVKYTGTGEVEWAKGIGGNLHDFIYTVAQIADGGVIAGGYFQSSTIEAGRFNLENKGYEDGLILKLQPNIGVPEIQELTVENTRKEFKITTDVKEIDGVKGGSISGEDKNPYELKKYGENSINEIKMTPDENYEIISITVNEQEYPFTANEDGTYTMPQFTNMTEDKHIEVTYALKDNKLIINKVDSKTKAPLPGATFKIDQIEERTEPENVIGELTANGETYYALNTENEITQEVVGELTNNGTYYFVQNEDGTLTPTNGKTYQTANGGSAGIGNTTANSYVEIDLSNLDGQYVVVVNAQVSSQSSIDYGYATINQSTSAPSYSTSTGRIFIISGTASSVTTPKDYESELLEGGNKYYLHLGYRKNSSTDTGDDQVVINSIKVYGTNSSTYNFVENGEGGYESNNQGKDSTVANSYIPIDLRNNTGKYNLTINAEISSQSSDYGYATVTTSTDRVAYNTNTTDKVRFAYISGEQDAQDYTTVLQGGQMYYLHLGYYKNASTSSGDDKFTVNSIKVTLNDSELYHTEVTTDSKGQGIVQLPFGKYQITETKTPEEYELKEEPIIIEFRADGDNHEITIENQEKAKVIVHHYLKDNEGKYTTTKVAEDELLEGKIGEEYTTTPHLDLQKYELEKDETGAYVIPENAKGSYESGTIEIRYYYEEKEYPLIVHHYIEGTTEQVPLATGEKAKDEEYKGKEGEEYTTKAISDEELDTKYELVEIPSNAKGTYIADKIEVIYYYRLKDSKLKIIKLNDENERLEGIKFEITNVASGNKREAETDKDGEINLELQIGEYKVKELSRIDGYKINQEEYTVNVELDKENQITIVNKKIKYFTLNLNKIDSETNEEIPGAKFTLSYITQYGEQKTEQYETDKDGTITLNSLEDEIVYTLKETGTLKGYLVDTEEKQFVVHYVDGKYEIEVLQGSFKDTVIENNTIKVNVTNTPSFKIVKQDTNGLPIEGVKFTITDEQGQEVADGFGNLVGEIEEINGEQLRVLTTNENGVIAENLLPGKYVLTEVQTPSKYILPEENERTQTIEITSEGFEKTYLEQKEVTQINNENLKNIEDMFYNNEGKFDTYSLDKKELTTNGKTIYSLGLVADFTIPGEYTVSGEDINLKVVGGSNLIDYVPENGINVIVTPEGKIEKVVQIKSDSDDWNYTSNTLSLTNGEYITLGYHVGTIKIPAEDTANNKEITLSANEGWDYFIAKYNSEGKIESIKDITYLKMYTDDNYYNIEMKDLGNKITVIYPYDDDQLTIPASETVAGEEITVNNQDGMMVVNLDSNLKVINAYAPTYINDSRYEQEYEEYLSTGEIIVGGYNTTSGEKIVFNENETTSGEKIELDNYDDGIIAKYDANGKVEWAKELGAQGYGGYNKITEVSDGYIAIAYYGNGDLVIPAEETAYGEEIKFENPENNDKQALIKYTTNGQVEWAVDVDSNIEFNTDSIIKETSNGYLVLDTNNVIIVSYEKVHEEPIVKEQKVVTIRNEIANGNVIVHHYKENTTESLSADQTITGKIDTNYETKPATDIPANYELVAMPENATGTITEGTTEVIYYYRLKEPVITTPVITKETITEKVTNAGQMIDYSIKYTAKIDDYIGKATVTIIDTLPYEIDEQKSNISGGTYKVKEKTITWEETIEDIDTFTSGTKEIIITKQFTLVYKDIDVIQEKIENKATGTIKLETPEKEETVEDTKEIPTEYLTNITVNKIWNDNETQSSRRPESIIIMVKNGDQIVQEKEVTKSNALQGKENQWTVTFEGLPKYNENGQEIKYTVDEKEKNTNDLYFYDKEITEVQDNQATIRNTFKKPDDTTSVTVTKNWEDNNNENNKRPIAIKVEVKAEGQTVKEQIINKTNEVSGDSNEWRYTFEDLPKYNENGEEIEYTVEERAIGENDLEFYNQAKITGDMETGYTITNTFKVPDTKISVTANKTWVDNEIQEQRRPESVVLVLSKKVNVEQEEGTKEELQEVARQEITLSDAVSGNKDKWQYTFENLPKYDENGNVIEYTVEEQEKTEGDLHFYNTQIGAMVGKGENGDKEVTITNTFTRPEDQTEVVITKIWNDNNNEAEKRPESIKLQLKNGTTTIKEQEITEANKVEGQEKEDIINKANENKELTEQISLNTVEVWQYTFTGIQKYDENGQELKYTADETEVHSSDLQFYTKDLQGTTIINTFTQNTDKTSVTVTKKWVDNEIQEQRRPESVIIQVKNGMEVVASQEINVSNALEGDKDTWQYTFEDLPKYDAFNNIINYTVDEKEKASGDLSFYSKEINGTTITNTFVKPQDKIQITVNKEWVDQDDVYKKRPDTINLQVKNGEEVIAEKTVSREDNWKYTFTNLDKYDENGKEINYTVDEEETKTGELFYYEKEIGDVINNEGTESGKQATITNQMTKLPSLVIVKYVDINTDKEIEDRVNKEGIVGETFDVTEDKKDIPGYTLVEEPEEKTGTYTEETQVKTYYYAKNTKVIVKYLEKDDTPEDDADNKVLSEQITIEGYEGKSYSTEKKTIEGYTYVESKGKTSGKMEEDTIEVVYYYAPNTKVIVKYLEKDNTPNDNTDNKVLAPEQTIDGYVGKEYDTEQKTITNYTFIESTENTEGTMTKDTIEVIYYYAQNTKVTVKYLEKDNTPSNTDNKVLAKEETIEGYEGQEYKTEQKYIEDYVFVESTNNLEGTMTKEEIEVIYYYAQKTKVKVEHIDRETGEILKEETKEGKVGDIFETHPEDFEGYVLVESPKEPNITMDKTGEQVVKYYYAHVSAGVIEKHIDEKTGELLYSEEHKGNEGDSYDIPSRNFDGYDLLEKDEDGTNRLPKNAKGEMTKEVIEVKYYYIKKATVRVEYIDKETGEKLTEDVTIEGHEGDSYETEEKEFKDYNLVETPENAKGEMTVTKNEDGTWNRETVVTYYYEKAKKDTTVVEKHIDINTNKVLAEETHKGKVGDEYSIPSREFEGYELVIEDENGNNMLPENSKGTMTEEEIEVIYYYEKQATVKVEYIDKQTGEKLDEEEIKGHVGDSYETEEKEFDGYELVEVPSNAEGEMTEEEIVVKYYYQRKAEVEVQYLEKDTNYKLAENDNITGYVGDKYETKAKDIPYYKLVDQTENTEGKMTKEKITVIYYYEKQLFNLSVDKWVSGTTINGIPQLAQNYNSRDELYKIDIHRSKVETADVKITYTIRITNTGEIEGTADRITELIPQGYTYNQEDNSIYWQESNGILTTDALKDEMIKPGEYKDIEIVLRWNKGENNFGQKDNTVILSSETNPAGYEDINEEDNSDKSEMLLTVATGLDSTDRVVVIGIIEVVLVISVGLLLSYKKKERKK